MSFGISAAAWVQIGLAAASAVYTADKQRKLQHEAQDAADAARAEDEAQRKSLDAQSALAANAQYAQNKRARQMNALALGGAASPLGGVPAGGQVVGAGGLGAGQSAVGAPVASVLGSGAPGGGYVPRQPGTSSSSVDGPSSAVGGGTGGGSSSVRRPY